MQFKTDKSNLKKKKMISITCMQTGCIDKLLLNYEF